MKISFYNYFCFVILFCFTASSIHGQSKFEYGVGLLINHSKANEKVFTSIGPGPDTYKRIKLLGVTTRVAYKINDRFHLNSGIGFSRLGALRKDLSGQMVATTLDIPMQLEWNPWRNIHLSTGLNYNYVFGLSYETKNTSDSLLPLINSKHQLGIKTGIAYSYRLVEVSLSYAEYFTDLFNRPVIDVNDNEFGTLVSKFQNITLGLIFRR